MSVLVCYNSNSFIESTVHFDTQAVKLHCHEDSAYCMRPYDKYRKALAEMSGKSSKKSGGSTIALNKKAHHEFHIEEKLEAGLVLEGWEVKSLRAGRAQLQEAYVYIKAAEAWLFGAHITPLPTASTHIKPDSSRTRKLLLHKSELNKLIGATERKGYTIVPIALYWKQSRAKLEIGLAKGKQAHDKRADEKSRDWSRDKQRILKHG